MTGPTTAAAAFPKRDHVEPREFAKQGALSAYGSLLRTPGYTCPSKNLDVMD